MGWTIEQNTGVNEYVTRCVWFKGYIYAFTRNVGVWRRDGIGPWVQVFAGGGQAWVWEDDNAIYCGGGAGNGNRIYRSEDGIIWAVDVDLNVTFGLQAFYHDYSEIGGYGSYLYLANHDVGGAGATYFYRRNLAGAWTTFGAPHVGAEGVSGTGIIGFGGEVYWTNNTNARYWDGTAWSIEATLDGQDGRYVSLIDDKLYVMCPTTGSYIGGYYWKTTAATNWAWMDLPVPDATWAAWPLCEGEDGETYTLTYSWPYIRIYRQVGGMLELMGYENAPALNMVGVGGICVDATGAMYWGAREGGAIKFFAFAGNYGITPVGGGFPPQMIDCDGDGNALYLALYDAAGFPLLIRVPLPLDGALSMGNMMFQPGAGDTIHVKCAAVGERLAISGLLSAGGNDSVQVSEDAGLTLTNIAPAWGDTAQPILVDPDGVDEIAVGVEVAQDLYDTEDQGANWTQRNAAVGYSPGAMARLPDGDELVVGDFWGNQIDYSPNKGQNLTNITGVFAGNVAALEVV